MAGEVCAISANAQNAGKLIDIDEWSPTKRQRKWLLISGASNPPEDVEYSTRLSADGRNSEDSTTFLYNVNYDLTNMQRALRNKKSLELWVWCDHNITKTEVQDLIKKFLKECWRYKWKPMLYYTGHGEIGTGNWCLSDGTIGIQEIVQWVPEGCEKPTICSDACYSGAWANYCAQQGVEGLQCLSACGIEPAFYYEGISMFNL